MAFEIIHEDCEHGQIVGEYETLTEATQAFDE